MQFHRVKMLYTAKHTIYSVYGYLIKLKRSYNKLALILADVVADVSVC